MNGEIMERSVKRDAKGNDTVRGLPTDERETLCRIHLIDDQQLDFIRIRDLLAEISPKRFHLTLSLDYEGGFREIAQGGYDLCFVRETIGEERAIPWIRRQPAKPFETPLVLLATSPLSRLSEAIEAGVEEVLDFNRLGPQRLARTIEVTIARQRRRIRMAREEESYRIAAERAGEGYWRWNPIQRCIELPPSTQKNLGLGREKDAPHAIGWASIHPEDVERAQYEIMEHAAGRKPQVAVEFRIRNEAGAWRWVLCRGKGNPNPQGGMTEICGLIDDITERKALVEQARHEAFHDPLTGLPNRALFTERLAQALKRRRREPH
ncbi:MAG: PAS domain S-box protein, partial [Deltaproteobacteria bacterium]